MINEVLVAGTVVSAPTYKYTEGIRLPHPYIGISTLRLSGVSDIVNVFIPTVEISNIHIGDKLAISGYLCSVNARNEYGTSRLLPFVNGVQILPYQRDENKIDIEAYICDKVILRETPLGKQICDVMLVIPSEQTRSAYIPAIAWGDRAAQIPGMKKHTKVMVHGRMQSRQYTQRRETCEYMRTINELSIQFIKEIS